MMRLIPILFLAALVAAIAPPASAQVRLPPVEEEVLPATDPVIITPGTEEPWVGERKRPDDSLRGGPGRGGGFGPGMGGGSPVSADAYFLPASDLRSQPGSLQVVGEGFSLGLPVRRDGAGIWLATTRLDHQAIDTTATLPGRAEPFPEELWNINLGLMHFRTLENGWTAGGMLGVGSASDQPFASIREMNVNLLAFLTVPTRERDSWNFSLMYSPLGQIAFPIPGVAYVWRPSEQFQANIGVPFSLTYRPQESLTFQVSYMPLTTVNASARWAATDDWTLYTGYQTKSQGYQLAERDDFAERFFAFDQRLNVGARRNLPAGFALDVSAAYLFDRSYFLSDSFFGGGGDRLRVDPGFALLLKLEWSPTFGTSVTPPLPPSRY